ncbi:MAG: hypothetical protein ABIE25_01035 [Thermoplasmatota archaeon]|nr:Rab5-interacting family protein [Candidatus Thermoplasmatota archaeon]MBU1914725.1 Rab5-interacting family protein [Candidatus Thermoplasmatota archaeon]
MAKKRRKDKEEQEDYEFRPPEFKENEFLKKELTDTRTAVLTIVYATTFGVIAGVISLNGAFVGLAFLAALVGIFTLKWFFVIAKVDTSGFAKKNWLGNIGSFFFTFLAVWVLLLNMPFSDHADPTVDKAIVWVDNGTTVRGIEYKLDKTQGVYSWVAINASDNANNMILKAGNYTINITAKVSDNGDLSSVKIAIGSQSSAFVEMALVPNQRYAYSITSSTLDTSSGLMFYISATDNAGNNIMFRPDRAIPVVA